MERTKYYKLAAAIILGLTAIFWFIKGFTDIFGGIQGGFLNLIFSFAIAFLVWLSWKNPLLGGVITASLAIILAVYFNLKLPNIYIAYIPLFLMCAPMAISGLLFIEADWVSKRRE